MSKRGRGPLKQTGKGRALGVSAPHSKDDDYFPMLAYRDAGTRLDEFERRAKRWLGIDTGAAPVV